MAHGVTGNTSDFGSEESSSSPSGPIKQKTPDSQGFFLWFFYFLFNEFFRFTFFDLNKSFSIPLVIRIEFAKGRGDIV